MQQLKNVMVVDDDQTVHFISKRLLSFYQGVDNIYSAYNGSEALNLLRDGCNGILDLPQILLLDLHMPVMDGFQLMKEMRDMECLKSRRIIKVMFSATIDASDIDKATSLGIDYFFSKPLALEKLDTVLKNEF